MAQNIKMAARLMHMDLVLEANPMSTLFTPGNALAQLGILSMERLLDPCFFFFFHLAKVGLGIDSGVRIVQGPTRLREILVV